MGQFRHNHSGKTSTPAVFWLRMSYHVQHYMYANCSLPVILLVSKKWAPGLSAEDNSWEFLDKKSGVLQVLQLSMY